MIFDDFAYVPPCRQHVLLCRLRRPPELLEPPLGHLFASGARVLLEFLFEHQVQLLVRDGRIRELVELVPHADLQVELAPLRPKIQGSSLVRLYELYNSTYLITGFSGFACFYSSSGNFLPPKL